MLDNVITENISGSIERITYHNEENGFCVLRVKVTGHKDLVTVVGALIAVSAGEFIESSGCWFNDKTHGLQFKASSISLLQPTSLEGIEKYLGSGLIKGIGDGYAKRLVKAFGVNVFEIIEHEPHKLKAIPGMSEKKIIQFKETWEEKKHLRKIIMFLHANGIGTSRAVRIHKTYGQNAIQIIQDNPYRLSYDIHGIGFKTADGLALHLGVAKDSMIRAKAGVKFVLQEQTNFGHCAFNTKELIDLSVKLLEIPAETIQQAINQKIIDKNLIVDNINGQDCVFLDYMYNAELSVVKKIKQLLTGGLLWRRVNNDSAISWVSKFVQITLSDSQKKAIQVALSEKVVIITGGPGVGKTTLIKCILQIIKSKTNKIILTAPTGRAAKRLAESSSMEAKTLHRTLEYDPRTNKFRFNEYNKLDADLIIVDEASMIDLLLMNNFLKAIPETTALIIVGDVDQLPSVGAGSVLANLIDSGVIATVRLTEIFRQAASSRIITNSHLINKGVMPTLDCVHNEDTDFYFVSAKDPADLQQKLITIVSTRIPSKFNLDPLKHIQVLSPMNRGSLGTHSLNIELKKALNTHDGQSVSKFGTTFSIGDKVIQTVNNYSKEIFNGDIGYIREINFAEKDLVINFDNNDIEYGFEELDEISLAYAVSIHKSQGSEYPAVVIPLAMQHYMLLQRNLIYTGITRGKALVVIVGEKKALYMAVKNNDPQKRITNLTKRLMVLN
jgi:exodeoxyribonuclease V alpha subunit